MFVNLFTNDSKEIEQLVNIVQLLPYSTLTLTDSSKGFFSVITYKY